MSRAQRFNEGDETPAMRREARARRTQVEVQEELKRLAREEFLRAQQRDSEKVRSFLEEKAGGEEEERDPRDYSPFLAAAKVAPDSRLGQNRRKRPGIQGRPSWA